LQSLRARSSQLTALHRPRLGLILSCPALPGLASPWPRQYCLGLSLGLGYLLTNIDICWLLLCLRYFAVCNFGQDWEVAHVKKVRTQYKALLPVEIEADVGVRIGLRSVNITLRGGPAYIEHNEDGDCLVMSIAYRPIFSFRDDV